MKYTLAEFIKETAQRNEQDSFFELESSQTLEINLNGSVLTKLGSMIAYNGSITFKRQGLMEQGLGKVFKKMISGEGMTLMTANGQGKLYLADKGKKVRILNLQNETIVVNGNDVLALEKSLDYDIKLMKSVAGMLGGGLFNVKITGTGMVALTTHGDPVTLLVTPEKPLFTDANATVAWSGSLQPGIKTDISFRSLIGRGSGESIQLAFAGTGWVVLQPFEETYEVKAKQ
jgi:uncharacterized protein (AIM24 family)